MKEAVQGHLLEMTGIVKSFPGVKALKGVDFRVKRGEVHALMGENGAGKSTLIKILTGIHTRDAGKMLLDGHEIHPVTSMDAQNLGISTIYQELNLIPYMSICENIFLGREPKRKSGIDWKKIEQESIRLLEYIGLQIDVRQMLNRQSTAVQQMVAIARALAVNAKLIVMDEPTSSLDKNEVKLLFDVIHKLKSDQISVVFVSHRLEEIYEICDSITILKDGVLEGEYETAKLPEFELVSKMVGHDVSQLQENVVSDRLEVPSDRPFLKLSGAYTQKLQGADIDIREGEILGLAGLLGSGRTEVAKAIFGVDPLEQGSIHLDGQNRNIRTPKDAIAWGLALCPEDRRVEGIIPNMSVKENITLVMLPKLTKLGIVSRKTQNEIVERFIKSLSIKTPHPDQAVKNLSGGNQQKVLLARWLCTDPKLMIMDEPTRGIDVGAKSEIEQLIQGLPDKGISVLMISSELPEILRNCSRILVMNDGRRVAELTGDRISQKHIMSAIAEKRELSS